MRLIALCLLALMGLAQLPAEAAQTRTDSRSSTGKSGKVARATPAPQRSAVIRAPSSNLRQAVARPGAMVGGRRSMTVDRGAAPQRAAARTGGNLRRPAIAQRNARAGTRVAQNSVPHVGLQRTSWQAGLPAADGEQRDCPVGTMSTLARGHDDVIRCMPM
jgi:hypothetical protein